MTCIRPDIDGPRRSVLYIGAAILVCLFAVLLVYPNFLAYHLDRDRQEVQHRLDALGVSIEETLTRHESLPSVLAMHPSLTALLDAPHDAKRLSDANNYLEAVRQQAHISAAYLINADGLTVAASNWNQPYTFVGRNYRFRPYFRDAVKNGIGRFYGVGVTTGYPGYFLAAPLYRQNKLLGVIVVKQQLDALEKVLENNSEPLMIVDGDGIAFLSSMKSLRYRSLANLSPEVAERLANSRQYGAQKIPLLADREIDVGENVPQHISLLGERAKDILVYSRSVGNQGWQLVQIGGLEGARVSAATQTGLLVLTIAAALGMFAHLWFRAHRREELRRVYASLEERIASRTADLTAQVAELEQNENILRATRDSAVQAGKLATLGQMSAGITHELNQPLAALHTYANNAIELINRGRLPEAVENLEIISDLVKRTGQIVRQLKVFARKGDSTPHPVDVDSAIEHARLILEPICRETGAEINFINPTPGRYVLAEAGRVEQILVNLLRNGVDAMGRQPKPLLVITCTDKGDYIEISVRDSGIGLAEEVINHLFEPFYTTKPAGEGLGLGLAISRTIAESYGGSLSARNPPDGGAEFILILPAAGEINAAHNDRVHRQSTMF